MSAYQLPLTEVSFPDRRLTWAYTLAAGHNCGGNTLGDWSDYPRAGLADTDCDTINRQERKYLLTPAQWVALQARLPVGRLLSVGGRSQFAYHSVYLDTPDLLAYQLAGGGRRHFEVRLRQQSIDSPLWLEVLIRGNRGKTVKERLRVSDAWGLAEDWLLGVDGAGFEWVSAVLQEQGLAAPPPNSWGPALDVYCRRRTILFDNGCSAVVDEDLAWGFPGDYPTSLAEQGSPQVILTTKTAGTPTQAEWRGRSRSRPKPRTVSTSEARSTATSWDRTAWRMGYRPQSFNEYTFGLADSRRLPTPHRTGLLRRYLAGA